MALLRVASPSGLAAVFNHNGSLRRFDCGPISLNLFVGSEAEGGPANLWLRRLAADGLHAAASDVAPLLGPRAPLAFEPSSAGDALRGAGTWQALRVMLAFELSPELRAWGWRVEVRNDGPTAVDLDLVHAQDLALAPYAAVRLNEYYVSQYVDHQPLEHDAHGWVVASRQNQAASGRHPWSLLGCDERAAAFATDALQLHGLASRAGSTPSALLQGLPSQRLQHEHSMVALQSAPRWLEPGERATFGCWGLFVDDHPQASSWPDLERIEGVMAWRRALPPLDADGPPATAPSAAQGASLFARAPLLDVAQLDEAAIASAFPGPRRHEERDDDGQLLSFFRGDASHVVLRAKELQVLRPHGALLRSGRHLTPDETALASTAWMSGVFHSMLTEGHVSINRALSTLHGYVGLHRAQGLRAFVEHEDGWRLLDQPSAFEMSPRECRWLYRHAKGTLEVTSQALADAHELRLTFEVRDGAPLRVLLALHVALGGDDGCADARPSMQRNGDALLLAAPADSDVGRRFPHGRVRIAPADGTAVERIGDDAMLYADGASRGEPFACIVAAPARRIGFALTSRLVDATPDRPSPLPAPPLADAIRLQPPAGGPRSAAAQQLAEILPWLRDNALVHYLSPRGLEQYSGGGWGTRDVCQGPVELLLASGHVAPVRDLLARVMRAQSRDGDWPQWFMFFERERRIRAGDSHGDIVFWPLLALAQYLLASGDAAFLDHAEPYFDDAPETVWQHAQRAFAVIERRTIAGTALAAYGHGDWNDALQPADPSLRERMCSAWTVTLHHQVLTTLADALHSIGRDAQAEPLRQQADRVRADFRRILVADGVLAGYALFGEGADAGQVELLLHPRDQRTGVRYSALAMIHAIDADLFTPEEARVHRALIDRHLLGPDGIRLFDRPLDYHGGLQRIFQRAESASFFGREIGLMYTHAHLRWAQALAHVGDGDAFFDALSLAHPVGLQQRLPQAARRQANCYYSSSDAAFRDRYEASMAYSRLFDGDVPLDGGWRVYSSGAGIEVHLVVGRLLGLQLQARTLDLDPVLPPSLDGLKVSVELFGQPVEIAYAVRGRGAGVSSVELDGRALAFQRAPNPHRAGAACVDRASLEAAISGGARRLRVAIGDAAWKEPA